MRKKIIIAVIVALAAIAIPVSIYAFLNQKPAEDIPEKVDQYQSKDPDTGEDYTVNGVSSGETFDKPWVYGQYSLKQAGLSQEYTDAFSNELVSYVVDTYKSKYDSIEILAPYITPVQPGKEYALKMRLGQVTADNVYLYATVTVQADSSLRVVLKNEASTVLRDVTVK